jgi:transcriptional regulator with XRE-family HTH domain
MPRSFGWYTKSDMPRTVPDILIWARETAGLSVEAAAKKLGVSSDRLISFEAGKREPTRQQLVAMSKRYHRPLLAFYLPKKPKGRSSARLSIAAGAATSWR